MDTQLVAVYGSLKKGFYNHDGLGKGAKLLGTMTVNAVMYSNGSYPKLYHIAEDGAGPFAPFDEKLARQHGVEVYLITDERYNSITRMEVGAGYVPETIETPFGPATMYWMPYEHFYDEDFWVEAYTHKNGLASHY